MIPNHLTTFNEALKTAFAQGIQMEIAKSFVPSDIEVDTRLVDSLKTKLTRAESEVWARNGGRPLAYRDLESLFKIQF